MTIKMNWPLLASVFAAMAGAVGSILTPLYGNNLSTAVQAVLQAISGVLLLLPVHQAATTASYRSQMRYASELRGTSNQGNTYVVPTPQGPVPTDFAAGK
jgi:hypothetical protein